MSEAAAPEDLKVPGANASTVHGSRIWEELFRLLGKGRSRMALMFHSVRTKRPGRRAPLGQVWPMPLPYPELLLAGKKSLRSGIHGPRKMAMNFIILVNNFLHVGSSSHWKSKCPGLGTALNQQQWAVCSRLEPLIEEWNAESAVGPAEMGRSASKVEAVESVLVALEQTVRQNFKGTYQTRTGKMQTSWGFRENPGEVVGKLDHDVEHVAKAVEADRLKFWGRPQFNPVPFLDDANQRTYQYPLDHARQYVAGEEQIPRVRFRCSVRQRKKFLQLLDSSGRLQLVDSDKVRAGLECGGFAIPKDASRDRLILDARPGNQFEETESRWINSLGAVHQFTHFFLRDHECLRFFTEDLREFYHSFIIGEQRQLRNSLKLKFSPKEVAGFSCFRSELWNARSVTAVLNTMAMGDCNAVAYGQTSHLGVLVQSGLVQVRDLITLKQTPPRQRWFMGLMIDDLLLAEAIPRDCIGTGAEDTLGSKKIRAIRDVYENVGLPRHEGKAEFNVAKCEFWGLQADGEAGRLRPNLKRTIPLVFLISQLIDLGHVSVSLLEIISGSLVSVFQVQRRHMSVLEEVYASQRGRSKSDIIRMSKELIDELFCCIGLTAITSIDLRIKPSDIVIASDASTGAEAAVSTKLTKEAVEELQNLGLSKPLWNRLLNPYSAYLYEKGLSEGEPGCPGEEKYEMNPVWEEIVKTRQFSPYGKVVHVKKKKHINLGEIQAALRAEEKFALENPRSFYIHLQDSQVSLACMVKGRSSSHSINKLLRSSIPTQTGQGIRGYYGYVRSKYNPADDPTRRAEIRKPSRDSPLWLQELEEGKFEAYDEFLDSQGLGREVVSGLPPESELYSQEGLDLRRARDCKADRRRGIKAKKHLCKERIPDEKTDRNKVRGQCAADVGEGFARDSNSPWVAEILKFRPDQFLFDRSRFKDLRSAVNSGPGVLDLFSGSRGYAKACIRRGIPWVLCFDVAHHPEEDLLVPSLQQQLIKLVRDHAFAAMGAGPVCASFSTAITPPSRTCLHPLGGPWTSERQRAKNQVGHALLLFVLQIVVAALESDVHFWVENPWSSWLWRLPQPYSWQKIMDSGRVGDVCIDYCRFGTKWKKRTRFRTSLHIRNQSCKCVCTQKHVQLRGRCPERKANFTKLAEPYPRGVCEVLAAATAIDCNLSKGRRKLDINSCAKCVGFRIGEAQHPGPRRTVRQPREGELEEVNLLEPATIKLRTKIWSDFYAWGLEHLEEGALKWALNQPKTLVKLLVKFGAHSFRLGCPLHYFRQLVAHTQKLLPESKIYISEAWELVSKWEALEPAQHRAPLPQPILEAFISLALHWDWIRWAGAVALCFFGACRIGEVLKSRRRDLLTPDDLMSDDQKLYLRILDPKSRKRGAKVQYATVEESKWAIFVANIFGNLPPGELLYNASSSAFRARWDAVLLHLGIGREHRLTPGSLRGGGAVAAHKRGTSVPDLLWKLRLQHQRTLAYYLQEVTAVSILPALDSKVRDRIQLLRLAVPKRYFGARSA